MPKYNELKHFNANKIATAFMQDVNNNGGNKTIKGSNTMTFY